VYRHLPERVKRQYGYIQEILRHMSDVPEILVDMVVNVFRDPRLWCFTDWGQRAERPWHYEPVYMAWYDKVSHQKIIPPDDGSPPRSANREQLIEKEHAREIPDTLTIIRDVVQMSDRAVAMSANMTKEELVQVLYRLAVLVALPLCIEFPCSAWA